MPPVTPTTIFRTAAGGVLGLSLSLAAAGPAAAIPNFVAVTDTANPIVTANVSGNYTGAAWVDVDDNGLLDLYICRKQPIYRNLGGGNFDRVQGIFTAPGQPVGTTWADYDNDGDIDAFTSGGPFIGRGSYLWRNEGGFAFTKIESPFGGDAGNTLDNTGWGSAFGDANGDGWVDIIVAAAFGFSGVTNPNRLLMNNGDGTFTSDTSTPITAETDANTIPTWYDYDSDGDADLFIGAGEISQLDEDNLFRNLLKETGSFGFERITDSPIGTDLLDGQVWNWIDYDNDGDLDAFQTNYNGPLSNNLYRNDGGVYNEASQADVGDIVATTGAALGNTWMDFDNDGDLDCIVTYDGGLPNEYWDNNGDGTFTENTTLPIVTGPGPHYAAVAADYDNDGDVDLYVHGSTATKGLFRNDLANGNHWLNVKLNGAGAPFTNRSALGTQVHALATIDGTPTWQRREVNAQNAFNGMSMLNVHFGLGDATVVDSLVVNWPCGGQEIFTAVAADQFLEINEAAAVDVAVTRPATASLTLRAAPNPFAAETTMEFSLPLRGEVSLQVVDVAGRVVRELMAARQPEGDHQVTWDGRDSSGARVGPGVYFARLSTADGHAVQKLVRLN